MSCDSRGFSLVELLIAIVLLTLLLGGLAPLLVQSVRINRSQQSVVEAQASARSCVSLLSQRIRSAGWDPREVGIVGVVTPSNPGDGVDSMEVFADLNEDGDTLDQDEDVLMRVQNGRVEWRRSAGGSFEVLADNITNDADGDGTSEKMFVPAPIANPNAITVRITARSPSRDPLRGDFDRFTVTSTVILRNNL